MNVNHGKQATRQAARRAAAEAQSGLMRESLERDWRCAALGVQVVTALQERDALVQRFERQAGQAPRALVADEATQWCAGGSHHAGDRPAAPARRTNPHPHVIPATSGVARREAHWA
jgi:hypothetical protein